MVDFLFRELASRGLEEEFFFVEQRQRRIRHRVTRNRLGH